MTIKRGDIYWVPVYDETGAKRKITHPQIVIQDTIINQSRISTIVVCGLSTNMKKANEPGNFLLESGEANLPKRSVVVVSEISIAKKEDFAEYVGTLSGDRVNQIFNGMNFIQSLA